jgi:RNA polymerase sigma-70 factor (ECF subfamily)
MSDAPRTSETLLNWLRDPANGAAWNSFAQRYGAKIRAWCLRRGLQAADADDVTQEILLKIHTKMRNFVYDRGKGRFRDWLAAVTYNACNDFLKKDEAKRYRELLGDLPARNDLDGAIADQAKSELLLSSMEEARKDAKPRDWAIFHRLTFEDAAGPALAAEFRVSVANIHMIASRMRKKLKAAIEHLGGGAEDGGAAHEAMPLV